MGENIVIAGVTFNDVPSIEVPKAGGGIATYTLGQSTTVEPLSVTENGTYTAPTGKAYSPVTVNVSGGGTDELLLLEQNQLTSRTSTVTTIPGYLFYGKTALISVSYPNATEAGASCFSNCTNLTTVNVPELTSLGASCFYGCKNLTTINVPKLTSVESGCFSSCKNLTTVNVPELTSLGASCFSNCTNLTTIDFPVLGSIPTSAFKGSNIFTTLILRKSDSICTLVDTNAFGGTPFANGRAGGTLYVPQDLIASYQSANKWSTILGYANNQIKAIEGSIYE